MGTLDVIEWMAVGFNLAFVLLIIRENKWGWPFGILGSLLSIYIFIVSKYYSEAILYSYYVFMGAYGWIKWTTKTNEGFKIGEWGWPKHLFALCAGTVLFFALGYSFSTFTDADKPYYDSFSTVFSFIATYMEAQKILSAWLYWIILNSYSVWLYMSKDLEVYGYLMVFYFVLSVVGYYRWRKSMLTQSTG